MAKENAIYLQCSRKRKEIEKSAKFPQGWLQTVHFSQKLTAEHCSQFISTNKIPMIVMRPSSR